MIANARPVISESRACTRHDGIAKKQFRTRREARRYARRVGLPAHQYPCSWCGCFHNATDAA